MRRVCNYLITFILGALLVLGLTLGASVNAVQAADTIELTYGGNWPTSHPFTKATIIWIDKIEKETNGRVDIKPFWASALYKPKDSAMELAKGVADIGDLSGAYAATGYDFEKSMRMVFWGVKDRLLARKVYLEALAKFPQLEKEFTDAGIKVMAYAGIPPYQLCLARKPVRKVEDLKGMTFKATGDLSKIPPAFGADGMVMPMSETYTALQKNTIDGGFVTYETLKTFRFGEVVKYVLDLDISSAPAGHWGFCMNSFNKLPKDIQKVFEDNVDWFGNLIEEMVYAQVDEGVKFAKEHGVEFLQLPPAELDKVYAVVDGIILDQMADLDKKGLDGTAVYKFMRAKIDEYSK